MLVVAAKLFVLELLPVTGQLEQLSGDELKGGFTLMLAHV